MTLRRLSILPATDGAYESGHNFQEGDKPIPVIQIDDETGVIYCAGVPINSSGVLGAPIVVVPTCKDTPYVSGTGGVGGVLNCTMGNWNGEPTSYAYQWKRDGTTNIGTNAANYTVVSADLTHSITCVVTATNSAGSKAAPPSNAIVA